MKRLLTGTAVAMLFAFIGCSSTDAPHGTEEHATETALHLDEGSCCGSEDSDLYGCTSDHCCARTGKDCGQANCVCRTLATSRATEGAIK